MIAGELVLTDFEVGIAQLERETETGEKVRMVALIARLMQDGQSPAQVIVPMSVEGIVGVMCELAATLSPQEKAMLMGRLTLKSVAVAQPGDVSRVADRLARGASGQKP